MAGRSNSLTKCITMGSLEYTLKSTSTGRPRLISYIERTSGSRQTVDEHMRILNFLVDCLSILSTESNEEKFVKAKELANGVGSADPPVVIVTPDLLATMWDSTDVKKLEEAVTMLMRYNMNNGTTLDTVFQGFLDEEKAKQAAVCGVIKKTKKSRACEAL